MKGEEEEIRLNERGKIEEFACSEKANKLWEEIRKNKQRRKNKKERKKKEKNLGKTRMENKKKKGRAEN